MPSTHSLRTAVKQFDAAALLEELLAITESQASSLSPRKRAARERIAAAAADLRRSRDAAVDEAAETAVRAAAAARAVAVRARELFGSEPADFTVNIWQKVGDRRLYIGKGYDNNWVEYYSTGNARVVPDFITIKKVVIDDLSRHREIEPEAAKALIHEFCRDVCKNWKDLSLDVTALNAPLDPNAVASAYLLVIANGDDSLKYAQESGYALFGGKDKAKRFPSRAAAEAAYPDFLEGRAGWHPKTAEQLAIEEITVRVAFPPKVATAV